MEPDQAPPKIFVASSEIEPSSLASRSFSELLDPLPTNRPVTPTTESTLGQIKEDETPAYINISIPPQKAKSIKKRMLSLAKDLDDLYCNENQQTQLEYDIHRLKVQIKIKETKLEKLRKSIGNTVTPSKKELKDVPSESDVHHK